MVILRGIGSRDRSRRLSLRRVLYILRCGVSGLVWYFIFRIKLCFDWHVDYWLNCIIELCCICIALPKLIETRIVYLIDLHAGMVIICVWIWMIWFGIKVTVIYITIGWWIWYYCPPSWRHHPGGEFGFVKVWCTEFDAECSKALDRLVPRQFPVPVGTRVSDAVSWF